MRKTITKSYETMVCDICGQEEDLTRRIGIAQCPVCKQDMCSYCSVFFSFWFKQDEKFFKSEGKVCKKHLPDVLIRGNKV